MCEIDGKVVGCAALTIIWSDLAEVRSLAVDKNYQGQGIGKQLIEETRRRLGQECMVVLLAAPKANEYYPKLGFEHNPRAWVLKEHAPASEASYPGASTPR